MKQTTSLTSLSTALSAAVQLVGKSEEPPAVPQGQLGGCVACGHTVASHFKAGVWVGCVQGAPDTVYVLVPANMFDEQPAPNQGDGEIAAPDATLTAIRRRAARSYVRFEQPRYYSKLHHKAKVEKLDLSDQRRRAMELIHNARSEGIDAKALIKGLNVPSSSVHSMLNWFRRHELVETREGAKK